MNKWKRRFFIVLSCLSMASLLSCSTNGIWPEKKIYEHALRPYVQEFSERSGISMANLETIKYSIVFYLSGNSAAQCTIPRVQGMQRSIQVRFDIFFFTNELQRRALMFHEILHCYCGRGHTTLHGSYWKMFGWAHKESKNKGNCPTSIMYPTLISTECLEQNWEEYMEEAFSFCPKDFSIFFR